MSQDLKLKSQSHPEDVPIPTKATKDASPAHESEDEFFSCKDTENSQEGSPKVDCETLQATEPAPVQTTEPAPAQTTDSAPVQTTETVPVITDEQPSKGETVEEKPVEATPENAVVEGTPVREEPAHHSQPTPTEAKTVSEPATASSEGKTPLSAEREPSH